jgi:choline dehydrogenase
VSDYVIVGAGSAGCVLANRLSADPEVQVTLLEAGGPDTAREIAVPAAFSRTFRTALDWDYRTAPVPALDGRSLYWPRGKVLGGSSSINAMIYIRGNPADYDGWAAPGWSFADVLPYFRRSENNSRGASAYHGVGGPLDVADPRYRHRLCRAFVSAAGLVGLPTNLDFNAEEQAGVGFYQLTQRRGGRASAASAFLRPVRERPNLTVLPHARARQVVFSAGRACAVRASVAGEPATFTAEREVILAAGSVGSPQLLMLSGIGPGAELAALGINPVVDNRQVGANLADHLAVGVSWHVRGVQTMESAGRPDHLLRYLTARRGPLASNIAEAGGFLPGPGGGPPDIQLLAAATFFLDHGLTPPPGPGFSTGAILLAPASRGRLRLASADPGDPPVIEPGYGEAPEDIERLVDGLSVALDICAQAPLARHLGARHELASTDRAALVNLVRTRAETMYHPTSTAAMGKVVDAECRVFGVDALRVVDASVFPTVPRGNTNAPTIMVAERMADLIGRSDPHSAVGQ